MGYDRNKNILYEKKLPLRQEELEYNISNPIVVFRGFFKSSVKINLHYHNALEVNICTKLKGIANVNGKTINLSTDPIIVIPPNTIHSYDIQKSDGEMLIAMISLDNLSDLHNISSIKKQIDFANLPPISCTYKELITPIEHYITTESRNIFLSSSIVFHILDILYRNSRIESNTINNSDELIKQIITYTEQNYMENISLDTLSEISNFSNAHFCRYFKNKTGITYIEYLLLVRLNKAKDLLNKGLTVSEVCFECGFNNLSYFIRKFKEYNSGLTPGKFLKNNIDT